MMPKHKQFIEQVLEKPLSEPMCLNLGCGTDYRERWVNVDAHKTNEVKPDIVWDLNKLPLPFPDEFFDYIFTAHTLEHLKPNQTKLMLELHRILNPGGVLEIRVPHRSHIGAIDGMEHQTPFIIGSFSFLWDVTFVKHIPTMKQSKMPLFRYIQGKLMYQRTDDGNRWLIERKGVYYYVGQFISFLANLNPFFAERVWCYWVGGFQEMQVVMKKEGGR